MQYSRQKKGQVGLLDAAAQDPLGGARVSQAGQQRTTQLGDTLRLTIGEWVFDGVPGRFDGIELRRVGGQFLQMQPRISLAKLLQSLSSVDRGTVPNDDDMAA